MDFSALPLKVISVQPEGAGTVHNVHIIGLPLRSALREVIRALSIDALIVVPVPEDNDSTLDVRRAEKELLVRRGRQAPHKGWRHASEDEAVEWLFDGASRSLGAQTGLWIWIPDSPVPSKEAGPAAAQSG